MPSTSMSQSLTHYELRNSEWDARLTVGRGMECTIRHRSTGTVVADGPYDYSFGAPELTVSAVSDEEIVLTGVTSRGVGIHHRIGLSPAGWLEEQITLTNTTAHSLDLTGTRCGFTRSAGEELDDEREAFTAIPFRREPAGVNGQYMDFSLRDVIQTTATSRLWDRVSFWTTPTATTSAFASEGWHWRFADTGFLVSKYSDHGMEWSLLDRTTVEGGQLCLRWGGIGIHHDQPERGMILDAGASHSWGSTRLTPVGVELESAYYAFRQEQESRGHACPVDFDPPVHWNELYDNKLYRLPGGKQDDPESRALYYTVEDMVQEAAKGRDFSCEALYLDPGWDTNFASKIWDTDRLGEAADFIGMIQSDYGLKVSLHTPMAGWCNPTTYAESTWRLDRWGRRAAWDATSPYRHFSSPICGASVEFREETYRRLDALAKAGVVFFMFDGTMYNEECWDRHHGHAVPARREAHAESHIELARMVHETHPSVLIEMHDPVVGGFTSHFTPIYYGHGTDADGVRQGFDTVWAFELMWRPLEDLLSGHAIALYYYNLAYSLPLYVHVDLKSDNEHCLVLWWNASTCRHLGIGGTSDNPQIVVAQQDAMRTYRRLKPYFTRGQFFGLGEQTHVHTARDGASAVVNCFNLSDEDTLRRVRIRPADVGLRDDIAFSIVGADLRLHNDEYVGDVHIPAQGHQLLEIRRSDNPPRMAGQ